MGLLKSLENTIAGLLEGTFRRVFRSEVRPMEIAHKLAREMDDHRTASVSRVYAPNEYLVWLSPDDRERYAGVENELIDELCAYLLEHARREELTLASRPHVTFNTDDHLSLGEFGIQARLVRIEEDGEEAEEAFLADEEIERARPAPGAWEPDEEDERGHTMIYSGSQGVDAPPAAPRSALHAHAFLRLGGRRLLVSPAGVVLGRSRGCDIVLDDPGVSRRHAEIRPDSEGWTIQDLGSTNGVYLNSAPIRHACELRSGDRIELGETELTFEVP
jgi:hypothetical protein